MGSAAIFTTKIPAEIFIFRDWRFSVNAQHAFFLAKKPAFDLDCLRPDAEDVALDVALVRAANDAEESVLAPFPAP